MDTIHLPVGLTLPSAFGAPAAPLQAGQVIQALVLELIEGDIFRLQLPQATIDVRSSVPLTPGNTITLAVKGMGPSPRLVIYTDVPSIPSGAAVRTAPAPNLAARTPIGEAVVLARTPGGQGASAAQSAAATGVRNAAPAALTAEPAVLRKALVSAPVSSVRQTEAPVRPISPEQAVTEAIRTAAPRQAGLAPLFADLAQIVQADEVQSPLPEPVRAAAADVLSFRVSLDAQLTAGNVKQAFVRSGVLFEPRLAAAAAPARTVPAPGLPAPESRLAQADPHIDPAITPMPRDDLKAALLVLRQVLKAWAPAEAASPRPVSFTDTTRGVAPEAARAQVATAPPAAPIIRDVQIRQIASALAGLPQEEVAANSLPSGALSADEATGLARTVASVLMTRETPSARPSAGPSAVPPPYRGAPLAAQPPAAPSIAPDAAPHEIAARLIAETDGALARQTLLQVASLPEQPDQPRAEATQRWNFEVPFATPQGTAIAQFEVSRDGGAPKAGAQTRTWRAQFSLDIEPIGPVHAMIALTGARTRVTLWTERATTATRLSEHAPLLSEALRAAELEPADLQLRVGAPPVARQAVPGRFMDRAS